MLELYENIKKLRRQHNWSQEELAKKVGYTDRSSIAKIENGKFDLTQSKIRQFAEVFGVSPSELMGNDGLRPVDYAIYGCQDYDDFIAIQESEKRERLTDFMHRMRSYYDAMNIDGQEHILQTCEDMMQVDRFRK